MVRISKLPPLGRLSSTECRKPSSSAVMGAFSGAAIRSTNPMAKTSNRGSRTP